MTAPVLECADVRHSFGKGELEEPVLRGASLRICAGEAALLMGASGSGKTTLLTILGCLLRPKAGTVAIEGRLVDHSSASRLTEIRRDKIGFVFQHAQLLPFLSVVENWEIVGRNAGIPRGPLRRRVEELSVRLNLESASRKRPDMLSGGQRQRAAIGRALVTRPAIVLADEPTASLDWEHGEQAVRLLREQAQVDGACLVAVTHDVRLLPFFARRLRIDRGVVSEDSA